MGDSRHILVIPSEDYLPEEGRLQGVFQQHQAEALALAGHRVGVISPILRSVRKLTSDWRRWGIRRSLEKGVVVHRSFGWYPPRSGYDCASRHWINAGLALYRDYERLNGKPDLLHAHNASFAGILSESVWRETGIPYVLTEHSSVYGRGLIRPDEVSRIQQAFRSSSARIVVSPSLGVDLERVIGNAAKGWEWVPNLLPGTFESAPLPVSCSSPGAPFRFLNVASLDEKKGHSDLLRAFAINFANCDDAVLRVVGDGPLRNDMCRLANELGIGGRVSFTGILSHEKVLAEMNTCDAFILSSRLETFGVVLIEAMACGKPVIATKCGGPEWFVEPSNGILVPPAEPDLLADAMERMLADAHRYDGLSIRRRCVEKFGSAALVNALCRIYDRVLAAKSMI
jgi:glycosyltransferase involved in cell wall biosynthesis